MTTLLLTLNGVLNIWIVVMSDALCNFSDEEETQPCILLEGEVTGNHEPFYFDIETLNHGPELAIINARRFNSVKELYQLL